MMTHEEFMEFVVDYESECDAIFEDRKEKYSVREDRLSQFFYAAKDDRCSPLEALRRMMSKHWTFMRILCENGETDIATWDTCLMDLRNYSLLAAALIRDERVQGVDDAA